MPEIIEQPFRLYQNDPVVAVADGVAATWSDIWTYQVPNGVALVLKPHHTFSAYINDGSEVGASTCQIKIEKRDSSKSDTQIAFGPALYVEVKEFQTKAKMARLMVPGEGIIVNEREFLIISVKDDGTVTTSATCYFELHIARIRKAIGA